MKYRSDIDGLRAVAVAAVVCRHADLGLSGGFVGVDVFFVISGYLITCLMHDDLVRGEFSLVRFWERRVRRILPALFVVTAATLLAGWFLLVPAAYKSLGRSVVSLATMQANLFFARHTGYFDSSTDEMPLLHMWSLAVEEQFYVVMPLLFWIAHRFGRRGWLGPAVLLVTAASFAYSVSAVGRHDARAYYLLTTRAWELSLGAAAALYARNLTRRAAPLREAAALIGAAAIIGPCWFYDDATPFPGLAALAPVVGAALVIVSGGHDRYRTLVARLLSTPALVGLGLVSYSLYLWHWPLLAYLNVTRPALPTLAERIAVVVASLGLAALSYRFVEQPFRRGVVLPARPRLFAATAAAVVCLIVAGQSLRVTNGALVRLPEHAQRLARTGIPSNQYYRSHAPSDVPGNLQRIGASGVPPRLLIWGDSHGMALIPALDGMLRDAGVSACCGLRHSCPPVAGRWYEASTPALDEAVVFNTAVAALALSDEIDAVLLTGIWKSYFGHAGFDAVLRRTIDDLLAAGKRVYFLKDVPAYDFDVAAELVAYGWHGRDVDELSFTAEAYAKQSAYLATLLPFLAERGVTVLDPIPLMQGDAPTTAIPPFNADGSFYFDGNHLSAHGAQAVSPIFVPLIDELARRPTAVAARPQAVRR